MKAYMLQQYSYHMWANQQVIRHVESLPAEVFLSEVNLGFNSVAEALAHILAVDEIWFERLKGKSPAGLVTRSFASVRQAGESLRELQQENLDYLEQQEDFDRIVVYKSIKGEPFQNTITEILQQVVNHGTYHRGNITTILRAQGFKGAVTDYVAFLRAN